MTAALRIATLAAGLVMASSAWADTMGTTQPPSGNGPWGTLAAAVAAAAQQSGSGGSVAPLVIGNSGIISTSLPPKSCQPGWTLVYVGAAPGGLVPKCAAVGDLRDPE